MTSIMARRNLSNNAHFFAGPFHHPTHAAVSAHDTMLNGVLAVSSGVVVGTTGSRRYRLSVIRMNGRDAILKRHMRDFVKLHTAEFKQNEPAPS